MNTTGEGIVEASNNPAWKSGDRTVSEAKKWIIVNVPPSEAAPSPKKQAATELDLSGERRRAYPTPAA